MSARARRRRAFLFLALALTCGGLAASEVSSRIREVESSVGRPVPVVVTARDVPAGRELRRADLSVEEVPERFAPPDSLRAVEEAIGLAVGAPLTRGSYLTASLFGRTSGAGGGARGPAPLRRGQRAAEVAVAAGEALAGAAPGARVDVLISTDAGAGPPRTRLALQDVEVLDLRAGAAIAGGSGGGELGVEGAGGAATATATLRVTLRQAIYLTAAENFAREVRLLPRPPGDRRRVRRAEVAAGVL